MKIQPRPANVPCKLRGVAGNRDGVERQVGTGGRSAGTVWLMFEGFGEAGGERRKRKVLFTASMVTPLSRTFPPKMSLKTGIPPTKQDL